MNAIELAKLLADGKILSMDIAYSAKRVALLETAEELLRLHAENESLRNEIKQWEILKDPPTLHVNLIRGFPCRLTESQLIHIAGVDVESLRKDAGRLDAIKSAMFQSQWNGVIDSGSKTTWRVTGDYRHFVQRMEGIDFSNAIDLAIERSKQ